MRARRHVLVVATQCAQMGQLEKLESAAEELCHVLLDPERGACVAGLADGVALLTGRREVAEIEAAVRSAVNNAADNGAVLVLAFAGHGFVPGDDPTLYLMAAESKEGVATSAVNVPALLAAAADRAGIDGLIAIVDTCNAAGAVVPAASLTRGSRQGRIRLDLLMASGVGRSAVDLRMTRELTALLQRGVDDAAVLDVGVLADRLQKKPGLLDVAFSRYQGSAGGLWLSRNARVTNAARKLGSRGYARYRLMMREAFPDLVKLPAPADGIRMLEKDTDLLRLILHTVDLLRRRPLRDYLTEKALRRAARTQLPSELFAPGLAPEAEVVSYLLLNPRVGQDARSEILRFVLTLADDAGCDLGDEALEQWIADVDLIARANEVRKELHDRRASQLLRLIVSLHGNLVGDWPESITTWLMLGDDELGQALISCTPTLDGVTKAAFQAVDEAHDIADRHGLHLSRIEVAAPAGLLLHWRPEEIGSDIRLGLDHDVVLHWSDRLKQSATVRRLTRSMRDWVRTEKSSATPFSWLSAADLHDHGNLHERLRNRTLRTAVALGCHPADAETVLTLLLAYTPIVIWPADIDPGRDPRARLEAAWHDLPTGFTEAYRRRWRDPAHGDDIAHLRAVWDDETWLDFCQRMQWRPDREGVA